MTRVWVPANDLAVEIGCSPSLIHLWWKQGEVRRRKAPKITRRSPRWHYNREDALERAKTKKNIEPFQIGELWGVTVYRCNRCHHWLPKRMYYEDCANKKHGLQTRCIDCYAQYHRDNYDKDDPRYKKKTRQAMDIQLRRTRDARKASKWRYAKYIDCVVIEWFVRRRYPDHSPEQLAEIAGHEFEARRVRAILEGKKRDGSRGGRIGIGTAERLLFALDLEDDLNALLRGMDANRPKWHEKYDFCQRCYRTTVRHIARGLCGTCYDHRDDPDYQTIPENRWSLHEPRCVVCRRTKHRHQAFGKCTSCYRKEWRAKRRARVGSGHGNHGQVQEVVEQAPGHQLGGGSDSGRVARHA